jgi:hypothetical protein
MGCRVLGPGDYFDGYDLKADLSVNGASPACDAEIFTFGSRKDETDWLRQAAANVQGQSSTLYPWFVVGNLWAVELAQPEGMAPAARILGGKQITLA